MVVRKSDLGAPDPLHCARKDRKRLRRRVYWVLGIPCTILEVQKLAYLLAASKPKVRPGTSRTS